MPTLTQTATNQTAGPLWAIALIQLRLPRQIRQRDRFVLP